MTLDAYDHDAWRAIVGVGVGYGVLLAAIFVGLFLVPYLAFAAL